ncbi:IclR family transcriptional regulator [Longimycelium tulufanense]|uniref:Glycerol operon regulatory protein n=1 Tax=Longimycelium tulufanense TaxID=907463 RepID=A0A8J3C923_9PSEU|nr:IclR family transcriptional regulator [Longimycelium tulufanense]GGM36941.1 IclR family transcriptional regulator [Longimycelium tulufanense]
MSGSSAPIESASRALRLLRLFTTWRPVRLSEVSVALNLPASTTHRLLVTLQAEGYVLRSSGTRRYFAGPALLELGWLLDDGPLRVAATPHLRRLVEEYGECAQLVALRGTSIEVLEAVDSPRQVRVGRPAGRRLPAHAVSGGKAMLALLPEEVLLRLYPEERLSPGRTRTDLRAELSEVRVRGYGANRSEAEPGIHGVGVAIVDHHGRSRGALVMSAPAARLPTGDFPVVAQALTKAAQEITAELAARET